MPNQLMQTLIEAEGSCCVYGYFASKRDEGQSGTQALADHLGVTDRDIRWWKQQIREGECVCEKLLCCSREPRYREVPTL